MMCVGLLKRAVQTPVVKAYCFSYESVQMERACKDQQGNVAAAAVGKAGPASVKPTQFRAPKGVEQIEANNILGFDANLSKDHPVSSLPS